ncbi:hypothetical protein [Vibrio owensii]|uniref:hypothetical protein n=1 Tax=Vibrio owensii TaxID=696485 RepID=UPI0018F19B20|nr:hypothetical protein [Vibrio owensii]
MSYFLQAIDTITDPELGAEVWGERDADRQITLATYQSMIKELAEGRDAGKAGWWNSKDVSIENLYEMRNKALASHEHEKVIVATAMIAAREMEPYLYIEPEIKENCLE